MSESNPDKNKKVSALKKGSSCQLFSLRESFSAPPPIRKTKGYLKKKNIQLASPVVRVLSRSGVFNPGFHYKYNDQRDFF